MVLGPGCSWWLSWPVGVVLGSLGFLVRVLVLSLLVGENLWVVITRAGAGLLDRLIALLQLPISPDLTSVQLMALAAGCGAGGDLCAVPPCPGVLDLSPAQRADPRATAAPAWTCCP